MKTRFPELVSVMKKLRSPGGCPWDRQQTSQTLKPYLLEETYEVLEAIDEGNPEGLKEELGDLLFQILFHSRIAEERGEFHVEDVLAQTIDKMVRRHPHVFDPQKKIKGGGKKPGAREVLAKWEELKQKEKKNRKRKSVLDGVPRTLPALMRANQLQSRASRVGFDWKNAGPVWGKIREEIEEFREAVEKGRAARIEAEFGDVMFSLVNLARFLKIDPEGSLRKANNRFSERFHFIEKRAGQKKKELKELTLSQMESLWEEAKRPGKPGRKKTVKISKRRSPEKIRG